MAKHALLLVAIVLFSSVGAIAQAAAPATAPTTTPADHPDSGEGKISSTAHQITIDGKPLAYHATTGNLVVKDETGKPKADMFFVAYDADNSGDPATRPITFLFNGGPGAAAVWLHLGAAGPKTIAMDE